MLLSAKVGAALQRISYLLCVTILLPRLICGATQNEVYNERLLVYTLRNGDILSNFDFSIDAVVNEISDLPLKYVPPSLIQLISDYSLLNLRLTLTQGFWRANLWDLQAKGNEAPVGVELSAEFDKEKGFSPIDVRWHDLIQVLNGYFSTSMTAIYPSYTISNTSESTKTAWRYGNLPFESPCIENLRAWKKFLPCKQSGLVSLLDSKKLFSSRFTSLGINIKRTHLPNDLQKLNIRIFISNVQNPAGEGFTLQKLFGRDLKYQCPIAETSLVFVDVNLDIGANKKLNVEETIDGRNFIVYNTSSLDRTANLIQNMEDKPFKENCLSIHVFTRGTTQIGGQIASRIDNPSISDYQALLIYTVPWQIRVYVHTLNVECQSLNVETSIKYALSRDRDRPFMVELSFILPKKSICLLSIDYETGYLKTSEYPADASSGIYIPSPILIINELNGAASSDEYVAKIYGEPLLILLPIPDFSMPFNVICFVCTLIAFFHGHAFTLTTKLMKPVPRKPTDSEGGSAQEIPANKLLRFTQLISNWFRRKLKKD